MIVYKMTAAKLQEIRAEDPKSWPTEEQLKELRSGDGLRICPEEIPEHDTRRMCSTIIEGCKRLFEDPEIKADFEKWKQARQAAADLQEGDA